LIGNKKSQGRTRSKRKSEDGNKDNRTDLIKREYEKERQMERTS